MKVSLNWIRDFLDLHTPTETIADILTALGLEVEGWETVKPSPVDLDKVFTSKVLSCERIPDTDHLSATTVDAGDGVVRSVVCGAPNVAAGQIVLLAIPGANVYSKDGQLFTIGERKVRGVPSQGMICAEDELGIGQDHSGIKILPPDTPLGQTAADLFGKNADTVIEIGLTPNRSDATCHLGVAKDLRAHFAREGAEVAFRKPEVSAFKAGPEAAYPVSIPEGDSRETRPVLRYTGVIIRNVKVADSPEWLQNRLLAIGQRPINNVVDITNYIRAELGQPLHAFDLAKIKGGSIKVQTLPEGTPFLALDEKERKLFAEDLMICDGADTPMCIGGVFGGADSGVTNNTSDIFLESACFNPRFIRRSMIRHNLRTDSAWTFEKGVDPNGCLYALQRAALLLQELSGGSIASAVTDLYPEVIEPVRVPMQFARINRLIGEALPASKVKSILNALEIGIADENADGFTALIPTNKFDVTREADVVEEILRVHGLDNVPIPTQIRSSMEIRQRPNPDSIRNLAADILAANGFNECMSLSLSNSAYHVGESALLPFEAEKLAFVHNTANQGLDCMRPTLLFGGLEAILRNQNRQNADLRLFEFGKVFSRPALDADSKTYETLRLGLFVTGQHSAESWQPAAKKAVDFYTLKAYVQVLLARLGVSGYQESVLPAGEAPWQFALRYHRGPQELVTLGQVSSAISKKMDIKNPVFYADFHFENIIAAVGSNTIRFVESSKFPAVRRDLALVVDQAVSFAEMRQLANKTVKKALKEVNLFDVFEEESKLGAGKKSYALSFVFEDSEKTLQDKDIDGMMQQLQQAFETKLSAQVRK